MFIDRFMVFLPKSNLKKAISYFNRGDYQKACKEFEVHVRKNQGEETGKDQELIRMYMVESYIELSRKMENEGNIDEAVKQLERAVELQPKYADIHYGLGKLYERIGHRTNSRESLKRALSVNPSYFRARVMLAKSYWLDGKIDRSVEELMEGLSAAPNFFIDQVKELIGFVKMDPDNPKAEELFHRLIEEKPSSSQISKQLALESIQNGDYDFAINELKKVLSLHPNYPDLHNLLGIAYANAGLTDDAIMEFETALKINPDYLKARLNFALTLYEKGAWDEAKTQLAMVLKLDPENVLAMNLMNELEVHTSSKR